MFRKKDRTTSDLNEERPHEHGRAEKAERTISEGIVEASADPTSKRLREDTPDEPGKPEAVNLERDEPVTNAARRRDSF